MRRLTILVFFILLACSKDSSIPDAVVPTPTVTFTLAVTASEGGTVSNPGDTHNENSNVSVTATPANGFTFLGWTGDASGSTNPLSVSMTENKNITATFSRSQYALSMGVAGQGSVNQELVSTAKSKTDYESGSTIRLTATAESGWLFCKWEGLSAGFIDTATGQKEAPIDFDNPIEITVDNSINATATFEQIIKKEEILTGVVGKWKIRKPKSANKAGKSISANCVIEETTFRSDGTYTVLLDEQVISGTYVVSEVQSLVYNIFLMIGETNAGSIENLRLTNNYITFTFISTGCNKSFDGDKDDTYVESEDPITGTVTSTTSQAPTISLVGESTIYLEVGDTFTDPGASASDNVDGDLTSSITSSGTVDTATEGTYTIVYSVSDAAGNIASVSRTVIVSLDLPPTITLTVLLLLIF